MSVNFGPAIFTVFIILLSIIFCSFFAAKLAELKGRTKAWGFLGFLLNIIGLIIVCYLPSKRNDGIETNPILHMFSKMPSMSRKTIGMAIALILVIVVTVVAYDNVPKIIENYKYTKQISKHSEIIEDQPKLITTTVKDVFIGENSSYLISDSGDLYCWGKQLTNQLENEDRGIIYKNVKKVDSNNGTILVLTNDGILYGKGNNSYSYLQTDNEYVDEFSVVSKDVTDFSLSETTLGIIKANNKLYMYGNNSYSQLGSSQSGEVATNVAKVVCESTFTIALQKNGDVLAFGSNIFGQFPKQDKEISTPTKIYSGIADIALGDDFALLLDNSGNVLACGNNASGQLGNLTNEATTEFVQILTEIKSIDACKRTALAISNNGELYTWGCNNVGQLGNKTEIDTNAPTVVATEITSAATDGLHTIALTSDKNVIATGLNTYSQLGKGDARDSFSELVSIK